MFGQLTQGQLALQGVWAPDSKLRPEGHLETQVHAQQTSNSKGCKVVLHKSSLPEGRARENYEIHVAQ